MINDSLSESLHHEGERLWLAERKGVGRSGAGEQRRGAASPASASLLPPSWLLGHRLWPDLVGAVTGKDFQGRPGRTSPLGERQPSWQKGQGQRNRASSGLARRLQESG